MTPSLASRLALAVARAAPFLRRIVSARARSPLASTRAFLQSIMPALVFSRSCLTSSGGMLSPAGEAGAVVVMGVAVVDIIGVEWKGNGGHRPPLHEETED